MEEWINSEWKSGTKSHLLGRKERGEEVVVILASLKFELRGHTR